MYDTMNTYSGNCFHPMKIKKEDINLIDISHALSLICRGGGHVQYFYSVGQHSINCAKEAEARGFSKRLVLACLLHDASEAYISDVIRPVKKHLSNYKEIEHKIQQAILECFHLPDLTEEECAVVKWIDNIMLEHELKELLLVEDRELPELLSTPDFALKEMKAVETDFIQLAEKYI